jgi:hypothetical protein
MSVAPVAKGELASLLDRRDVDSGRCQALEMLPAPSRIHGVDRLLSEFQSFLDEREQQLVLIISVVEESADMNSSTECRACEPYNPIRRTCSIIGRSLLRIPLFDLEAQSL